VRPGQVVYHYYSRLARVVAYLSGKSNKNWCVTLGRHCFVTRGYILGRSRAHEYCHTLQGYRWGRPRVLRYLCRYLYWLIRKGYKKHPMEIEAKAYAVMFGSTFGDLP
jgi:hypothetical protein